MIRYIKAIFAKKVPYFTATTQREEFIDVGNDLHIFEEFMDNPLAPKIVENAQPDGKTYFIGDIFGRSGIAYAMVEKSTRAIIAFKKKMGKYYIYGNHELMGFEELSQQDNDSYVVHVLKSGNKVLLTHGDLESDPVKWKKYRTKKPGTNKLGLIRVKIFDTMDWVKGNVIYKNMPEGFLERAAQAAAYRGCSYYVCGHFHVENQRNYKVYVENKTKLSEMTMFSNGTTITVIVLPAHKLNRVWF